ncbi:DNA mismatch repair protein MutS [Desulfovibrio sp. OttesenSCG-928-F07]|nr:DNA mismatch repair protein MutS [Desulfovibrio sp. OttesenSCG-928-F07]
MFEQYMGIKADYADALLFYRMGDFFELFFEDAKIVARELQLTLTSRNPKADDPIPMAGVPHHALEAYLPQLLEKGYKVVICDQIENPKEAKGLVKRAVTRILTPGTVVDESALQGKEHNYLGALYWDSEKGSGGFAWVDNSTGAWSGLQSTKENELWQWVQKMAPKELLLPEISGNKHRQPKSVNLENILVLRMPYSSYFSLKGATERVLTAQGVKEADALGLGAKPELTMACGALIAYLNLTQRSNTTHLLPFTPLNLSKHLIIDEVTERNLEIFNRLDGKKGAGTLWHVLDYTLTPMGGRLLEERLRQPWREQGIIQDNLAVVEHFVNEPEKLNALRELLKEVYDIERLSTRISLDRAMPRDFAAMRQSLSVLPKLHELLQKNTLKNAAYLSADESNGNALPAPLMRLVKKWDNIDDLAELLQKGLADVLPQQVTEGGLFRQGFNPELDELLDLAEHGEHRLNELVAREQEENNLGKLKLGYNRVFGYYFELSKGQVASAPPHFIRRQTLANAERYTTEKLKVLEEKLLAATEKRNELEYRLFQNLRRKLADARVRFMFMSGIIAAVDYWQGLAFCARKNGWCKPALHSGLEIHIRQGRHPVVEALQGKGAFIPNDLHIDERRRLILITGPNMAGKSTVLRQTAIIVMLAQMGSFVPATEATIGLADRIFSRVGASDNLAQGQSTFMVEMMETARILRQSGKRSLVILDEIGRGTSTYDGLALAWAVVEELAARASSSIRTLFATHYHELTGLDGTLPGVHNMNVAITEYGGELVFLHKMVPGPSNRSYGIEVAKLAGVPQNVVQRAKFILSQLNKKDNSINLKDIAEGPEMQFLPGLAPPVCEDEPETEQIPIDHPLVTTLKDLDVNGISPMQALELLHDWKMLWGNKND